MKNVYKISLLLFILLISVSFVSAADNSTQHTDVTANKISHTDKIMVTNNNPNTITKTDDNITTTKKVKTVQNKQQTKNIKTKTSSKNVKIIANNVKSNPGKNITFTGRVVDNKNKNVTTGNVVVKINGKTAVKTAVKDKKFTAKYTIPSNYSAKNYKLQYVYVQNKQYNRYELNKTLTLTKPLTNVKITANNVNTNPGKTVTFTGSIVDNHNKAVTTGNVVVKINGKTAVKTTVKDKKFTAKYTIPSNYSAKNYKLQYVYVQNKQYNRYELNKTLTLTKPLTNVKIIANNVNSNPGKTVTFTGRVVDNKNNNVTTGNVVVKINGKTAVKTAIKDKKFTAKYTIPSNYSAKNYKLQYVYVQNSKYNRYELNKTLKLSRYNVKIVSNDVRTHTGDTVTFTGFVTDQNKNLVSSGKVQIRINGTNIATANIKNNTFSYQYTVPDKYSVNDYTLQYVYTQNNKYNGQTLNKTLYVLGKDKKTVSIIANSTSETDIDGQLEINGVLLDSNRKPYTNGATILLKLDGRTMEMTGTGNDGKFRFYEEFGYTRELSLGTHTVTLTAVAGATDKERIERSELSKPLTVKNYFVNKTRDKVIIEVNNTQGYNNQTVTLSGHVKDIYGDTISTGSIMIKRGIDILYRQAIEYSGGNFCKDIKLDGKPGDVYQIQYIYLGNNDYERTTINRTVRITDNDTIYISSSKRNMINAQIKTDAIYNLTVKVNGTDYVYHGKVFTGQGNWESPVSIPLIISKNFKVGSNVPITFTLKSDEDNITHIITKKLHILNENEAPYTGTITLLDIFGDDEFYKFIHDEV